ncbi:multicopper oxidase domain-containing protein [Natronosporangium hydrolyticum]|uniref:Multicopper oxidase domain-containing protein n=1 Tax=Natronosporangium hydrolyticum TaxID=2811111 RepID=A0A895YP84_9ACTN|nr:multicopper oxidase domain-containing protein [Natronosporangium hydrolyticum]QSB15768.1 multicopper oxidase domain-containing protein [Natronosporangium hydrolyticum]
MRRIPILIASALALVLLGGAALAGAGAWTWQRAVLDTTGQLAFDQPLAIPPLLEGELDDDGHRVFDLAAGVGQHDLGGGPMETWGYNGDYLGPTLRASRGEQVTVNIDNQLPDPTTVHWHGMGLPAAMDGGPHTAIGPGESAAPSWRIDQPAATLWYHPHPHGETEQQVYRGLAGLFLIEDEPGAALPLPDEYGVDDIPVVVQDKQFDDGELDASANFLSGVGILGDSIVVNGTPSPYLDVTTERVRLRLLNGSTARSYDFGFADDRRFALIGTDGGLLSEPHHTTRVMLSPGERAELVVELAPAETATLRSYPPELGVNAYGSRFGGGDDTLDILQLRAADQLAPRPEVPTDLVEVPRLDPAEAVATRSLQLGGSHINGQRMDMSRIDFAVTAGSVEVWRVQNADGTPHNFHIHDVQFQVLSVGGAGPPPELAGWKDTVYLPAGVSFELIARFSDYPDPDIPYMFHCHLLRHEDDGMMGQFVLVEEGQSAGDLDQHEDHGHGHHDGHGANHDHDQQ